MAHEAAAVKQSIDGIEVTDACLSGRAGLALISKYLQAIGIAEFLAATFQFLKKSSKGTPLVSMFHQLLCFFIDGTGTRLVRFDELKRDEGYAATIETQQRRMVSSHAVKRLVGSVSIVRVWMFRKVLRRLFVWRLWSSGPSGSCWASTRW
jgi:hypothetical protein